MTTQRVRGTALERASVVAMILVGGALPVAANLPLFQDVVWVFWLAGLALIVGALILVVSINWRGRRSSES
ncbi:hypothetical protein [Microbacterium oxydans]|uniref:hypothetical protein n=1 Tax=Microbacterium oxydans TaxID=82380 RepID=UPI000B81B783|nr:hypothetical protein [Microbacterium oxydans]